MKRILITGGSGFIGSNFIRYYLSRHPERLLVNLDKLTYAGNPENLKDLEGSGNYRFIRGDVCDPVAVNEAMKGVDTVIHFAAESHVDRSIESGQDFVKTNVLGTYVLLNAALGHDVSKFIHVSTDEVYGSIAQGSFKETDQLNPSSPYSSTKAGSDLLARSFFITHGLPVLVTRCTNNFGPYQYPEKLIPLFITNLLQGKQVPVYGSGKNIRDWIYVLDHCRAIESVLENGSPGEIYNIGSDNEKSNIQITELILKALGMDKSMIRYVEDRKGHDLRYSLDSTKVRGLGWRPAYNFEKAMAETIEWYKANPQWWSKLKK